MESNSFSHSQIKHIWQQVCSQLQLSLSPAVYNTWIVSNPLTELEPQDSGRLRATITSPTAFHASNIKKNLEKTIQESLQEILQHPCDISYAIGSPTLSGDFLSKPTTDSVDSGSTPTQTTHPNTTHPSLTTFQSPSPSQNTFSNMTATIGNRSSNTPYRPNQSHQPSTSSPRVEDLFSESTMTSILADRIDLIARKIGLRTDYTFEQFAVSTSNEMAHAAATAVAKRPGEAYNPLFLYGGVGVGKTHLMHAIGNYLLPQNSQLRIIYCSGEEFTNEIVSAIQTKQARIFKQKYRNADLLLIDDIQFIAGKNAVQEEFFHTFNALIKQQKQVVLTSDKPPQEIALLEDRLRSRFQAGLMIDIGQPSFELRTAIVLVKARNHNLNLNMDMARHIATTVDSARKIEGIITSIRSEVELKEKPISDELIKEVLKSEIAFKSQPILAKPSDVIKTVAHHYQLKQSQLRGKKRTKNVVTARHVAMFILKEDLGLALVEVGRWFSDRDHTTVLHAVNKIQENLEENQQLQRDMAEIRGSFLKA